MLLKQLIYIVGWLHNEGVCVWRNSSSILELTEEVDAGTSLVLMTHKG